jgi:hypothetical protein
MEGIELFDIPEQFFESPLHFREYLASEFEPAEILHNLTLVAGLTRLSKEEFEIYLESRTLRVAQRQGAVLRLETHPHTGTFDSYFTFDEDALGVVIFYTNFRKTKEIPLLQQILVDAPKTYRLVIRPSFVQQMLDELVATYEGLRILDFSAGRSLSSRVPAQYRPEVARTVRYWGEDGRRVLDEMAYAYGVSPRKLRVELPGVSQFSLDNQGILTLFEGKLGPVLEVLERAVNQSTIDAKVLAEPRFQLYPMEIPGENLRMPVSTPVSIDLDSDLEFYQVPTLLERLEAEDFLPYNSSLEEGSLFLKSDILDVRTSEVLRLRANESQMWISPGGAESMKSMMRFYEFILDEVDSRAQLVT